MFRRRKLIRVIAIFFTIEMLATIAQPYVAMALTSGPTSPEATSFEPIDTTDMVNPLTGDFVYNVPLLEVPGPAGGFPIAMSYHGGILAHEEASWVGLGWTLNPGAINRHVNGFADDHKEAEQTSRFFWEGGESHQVEVGVTYGIGGIGYSQGASIGTDTYQGFGVGGFAHLGVRLNNNIQVGVGASVDPWGNPSANLGVSAGIGKVSVGAGIQTNFQSVQGYASGGVSVAHKGGTHSSRRPTSGGSASLVGASISTDGNKVSTSLSLGGVNARSTNTGRLRTNSFGFVLPIPFLHLGYNYKRYWIDQMEHTSTNGVFYNPIEDKDIKYFDHNAFDSYSLPSNWTIASLQDPDTQLNGTFPAYDNYSVNAQGVSGAISPHSFRQHLYRQNKRHYSDADEGWFYDIIHQSTERLFKNDPVEFRFINEFSNRYDYQFEDFDFNTSNNSELPLSYNFINSPQTGELGNDGIKDNQLAGSKNVRYYTNAEVLNSESDENFIETVSSGFDRTQTPPDQIAGYQITNESGVTYHFSLPAYASEEFYYSERIDEKEQKTFNYQSKPEKYAYTWHLTAITGPDYVDRGSQGFDTEDWGYWVELEYGKWTDQYIWRTPDIGMKVDLDTDWKNYSEGKKELYYLDAVRTKTHTALFIKDIRSDAKSAIPVIRNRKYTSVSESSSFKESIHSPSKTGSFIPQELNAKWKYGISLDRDFQYTPKPVSSLKLSKILLMKNKEDDSDKAEGSKFHQSFKINATGYGAEDMVITQHMPDNILDIHDIDNTLEDSALRVIELKTDNETLSMECVNSFDSTPLFGAEEPPTDQSDYSLKGKLTLNSIKFYGKRGVDLIPGLTFNYEGKQLAGAGQITEINSSQTNIGRYNLTLDEGASLNLGDIIKFNNGENTLYGSVYEVVSSDAVKIQNIGRNSFSLGDITWTTTKNPPYNEANYDEWGMYKGDYWNIGNDHIDRIRTESSKNHVDVWSLRSIDTALGGSIEINYESDNYSDAALVKNYPLIIDNINFDAESESTTIRVASDISSADYFYDEGDEVDLLLMYREAHETCSGTGGTVASLRVRSGFKGIIEEIEGNLITVGSKCLSEFFNNWHYLDEGYTPCNEMIDPYTDTSVSGDDMSLPDPPDDGDGCREYIYNIYVAGNLKVNYSDKNIPGGAVRVTDLKVKDPFSGNTAATQYEYEKLNGVSSGVTSFAPKVLDKYKLNYDDGSLEARQFRYALYNSFSQLIALSTEVPAPGVMYENVTIRNSIEKKGGNIYELPSYTQYEFQVFESNMIDQQRKSVSIPEGLVDKITKGAVSIEYDHSNSLVKKFTLKDYTSQIGDLKRITVYSNNDEKISETINHYLSGNSNSGSVYENELLSKFNNQGKINETFIDARAIKEAGIFKLYGLSSQRVRYPSIRIGQTTKNFKTGISTTSKNLEFDFYSGSVTKTLTKDSYGQNIITETVPAYQVRGQFGSKPYAAMGLAIYGGANMLTQVASKKTYTVESESDLTPRKLLEASVQTWSDQVPEINGQVGATVNLTYYDTPLADGTYKILDLEGKIQVGQKISLPYTLKNYIARVVDRISSNEYKIKFIADELQLIWNDDEEDISSSIIDTYRKHRSYNYLGNDVDLTSTSDGLYPYNQFQDFTAWEHNEEPLSDQWQKNNEITLYDASSHALEAMDVNGNYAATKMDIKQEQVYATVANAQYNEFAYSGAEDAQLGGSDFGGGVITGALVTSEKAHTGDHSIKTEFNGEQAFIFNSNDLKDGRDYRLSVWATNETVQFKLRRGSSMTIAPLSTSNKKAGEWYLHEIEIEQIGNDELSVWCEGNSSTVVYWDDFRFHPHDATMTSYVYNEWDELSYILDANNMYTHYEYDGMGRLKSVWRETLTADQDGVDDGKVRVSNHEIHYAKQN